MEHDLSQAGKKAGKMLAKPFRMAFVLVGLAAIVTTLLAPWAHAADGIDGYRLVRVIDETGRLGYPYPNPMGLAYSPRADSFGSSHECMHGLR